MNLAPIVLFVYNRPWHTQQTLAALVKNELAQDSILYVFADGAKQNSTKEDLNKINQVHSIIEKQKGFKEIHFIKRDRNFGLADNIVTGVTEIVNKYGKIIVLEDDIVTSTGFIKYMNDALNLYENEARVYHVSGYMFPVKNKLPETFFYNTASCWGWGSWQRAWKHYNPNASVLLSEIKSKNLLNRFDIDSTYMFSDQLKANINGELKTWAVKWYASFFLLNGFSLHPYPSLVNNIGHDGEGENCDENNAFNWPKLSDSIYVKQTEIISNQSAWNEMKKFNKTIQSNFIGRISLKLKSIMKKIG